MASDGLITSQLACKCLNIRIYEHPTADTPPPVEVGFRSIYVGQEGIRVAHTEVTLRSCTKPAKVEATAELTRYTTITCLICGQHTYRVKQRVTPDLSTEEGPLLPTSDWALKELCKSTTGWIEIYPGCLTGDEICQAEASPMYSKLFLLVLPGGTPPTATSQLSEDAPSAVREPSELGKTHLPVFPALFLPPPFSPSHVVFSHFAVAASERSQKLRDEAEQYIAEVTQQKVAEVLLAEAALKQEVTVVWNRFKKSLRLYEQGTASYGPVRRRSVSGHTRSTSHPSTRAAAQATSASVRITNFIPSPSHSPRTSPPRLVESALSTSIKTSGFHYPDVQRQTNGNASPPANLLAQHHDRTSPLPVRSSTTTSTRTAASNTDVETSIREAHRREIDENKDLATSYRYVTDLEAQMEQQRLQAEQEDAAISSPPSRPPGSHDVVEGTGAAAARGHSPRVHRSAIKQRSKSPKDGVHADDQMDGLGRGKRKVTFDIQPEVAIIAESSTELPTPPASNEDDIDIFDMDNESEHTATSRIPVVEQSRLPQPPSPGRAQLPPQHPINRVTSRLPPQLSSLRPASLPVPSMMHPPQRHPTSPMNEGAERSRALRESLGAPDAPRGRADIVDTSVDIPPSRNVVGNSPVDPREEELLRLVAASTPSHRSAWKKNSKAWQVFLSRRERRVGELGPESIAEEGNYVFDDFDSRARHFDGAGDSDATDEGGLDRSFDTNAADGYEDDASDPERPIAQSLPIPIGPLKSFTVTSYQPKTSLSDRPGMLVPALATGSLRHGIYAERGHSQSIDPGALDFTMDDDSLYEDDVESDPESGGKARQRALKILKARNEMPAAGMWRSLA